MDLSPQYDDPESPSPDNEQPESKNNPDTHQKGLVTNLDWSENGLTSLDSLSAFQDLINLNLSKNRIRMLTKDLKSW